MTPVQTANHIALEAAAAYYLGMTSIDFVPEDNRTIWMTIRIIATQEHHTEDLNLLEMIFALNPILFQS